jgi:superfamily I DNA/RNA helicase
MIPQETWQPANGLTLEPNADRAVREQERCLALTAGPGAGKTEMLAQRADFLLRTGKCRYPRRILAISFKVDASRNLKERIKSRCGPELADRFDSYTFHAFAKHIIDRFRVLLTGADTLDVDYKIGIPKVPRRQIEFLDLIPLAIKILRKSAIARNAIRQSYSDVFLDEFQDCTNQQYELVKVVFLGTSIRLTAVGDTKKIC